ncbi:hypothetical protein HY492_00110 [Candidatus Woesearchaeota archaeon]|nr:hypothetical protein [Candidatus Woesearchaeota archaeon]
MRLWHIGLLLLAIIAVASVATTVWFVSTTDPLFLKEEFVPMDVKVEDHFGFNTDIDAIHFGKVPPLNEGVRGFVLNNTYPFPVIAELTISGEMAPWVSAAENLVLLPSQGTKQVNLTVTIPDGQPYGLYTGLLRVVFKKEDV